MSLESDLRSAVNDLAFDDEAAAEIVLHFVLLMNADDHKQSAASMVANLGIALLQYEEACEEPQQPIKDQEC